MVYHATHRFLKKTKNLPLTFGYFHFSASSSTFLTASWLLIFVSAKPNQTILLIDRSEPRFECHRGGKTKKTLKNDENFKIFVNFWLTQIQNCSVQIKKMEDKIFSFQLKKNYFCRTSTDNGRHENVPLPLDFTRILKSCHKTNDSQKNRSSRYQLK